MKKSIDQEVLDQQKRGVLLVLTGPTGAGKDALFAKLQEKDKSMLRVITTTSRQMRPNEQEGNPYHFISRDAFEQKIAAGEFFEWVEFRGGLYGTEKKVLTDALSDGHDVIWHIDTKGVKNIKDKVKQMTKRCVFVFLTAPSLLQLEQRVKKDEGSMHRWNPSLVSWEMGQYDDCDYLVLNDQNKLDEAVARVYAIIQAKRSEVIKSS